MFRFEKSEVAELIENHEKLTEAQPNFGYKVPDGFDYLFGELFRVGDLVYRMIESNRYQVLKVIK